MTMLLIHDLGTSAGRTAFEARLERLCETTSARDESAATVAHIIDDVRQHGDEAVVRYMRKWTDPQFTVDRIRVPPEDLDAAVDQIEPRLKEAIAAAIDHVRTYQMHIKPSDPGQTIIDGAELGLRFTPVDSVALTVPGGTAVLFSTLIMLAVPAHVAGVDPKQMVVLNPPPTRAGGRATGDISPIVQATCSMLGIEKLYRIGGAQGVAAVAWGTECVDRVQMVAGPGNVFVQLAKTQLNGIVGTDGGFYGPSEITTIADQSADPACIAADLIAQAEHDPGRCFLIAWSRTVIDRIVAQICSQLPNRRRRRAIESSLIGDSCAILVVSRDQAINVANSIACEHVHLAVSDPEAMAKQIRHAGEIFLGDRTPVAAGDYYAGPSHCLPTASTARFASGISVYTFLKRSSTVRYRQGMSSATAEAIARLAEAEGLDGHADSARLRRTLRT